jgi:hypothetical protein
MTYLFGLPLANLRLRERAELGRAFDRATEKIGAQAKGLVYVAEHLDSRPEYVFVFGSCKNLNRAVLLERMEKLMFGAMAFFGKERCLLVMDRDKLSYEVGLARLESRPTVEEIEVGHRLFGHLRISDRPLNLVPHSQ